MITKAVPSGPNRRPWASAARVPSPSFTAAPSSPYAEVHHSGRSLRRRVGTCVRGCLFGKRRVRGSASSPCAHCGSGPGALRADLGPAGCGSTESRCLLDVRAPPGSHLADRVERSVAVARALSLAASGGAPVRHTIPDPAALRRLRGGSPVGRPVVDPAEPTGQLPSAVNSRCDLGFFPQIAWSAPRMRRSRDGVSAADRRTAPPRDDHSPGRTKTVRPPTTVRRQTGRSAPGVRSGRPGVPERGSVDQRATRSSGAWTTRSSVRQTA